MFQARTQFTQFSLRDARSRTARDVEKNTFEVSLDVGKRHYGPCHSAWASIRALRRSNISSMST